VDFGAQSAVSLVDRYDNLLVTQTFSKSRSMAGARLGFGIGNEKLIADLNTIKYSTNPYNVNRLTAVAGYAALCDNDYYMDHCRTIEDNRAWTTEQLTRLGFTVIPSKTNFVFAKSERIGGQALYEQLKARGVLVRHFAKPRIADYNRITIGTMVQMQTLIKTIESLLEG
jgi:histidinol-phosphate aminotransferase